MSSSVFIQKENKSSAVSAKSINRNEESIFKTGTSEVSSNKLSNKCPVHNFGRIKVNCDNRVHNAPLGIQRKLLFGQPGDKYEMEADAIAEKVVQNKGRQASPHIIQRDNRENSEKE